MADGRGRDVQPGRGEGEAFVLGYGQKFGQAVERIVIHERTIMKERFIVLVTQGHFSHQ